MSTRANEIIRKYRWNPITQPYEVSDRDCWNEEIQSEPRKFMRYKDARAYAQKVEKKTGSYPTVYKYVQRKENKGIFMKGIKRCKK